MGVLLNSCKETNKVNMKPSQNKNSTPSSSAINAIKPIVAVIGRPNVGKSTFVNRITGARKAIVDDIPGITRDRSYYDAEWSGTAFRLIDTGGIVPDTLDFWETQINEQVAVALAEADVLIFLVDGQAGITSMDEAVAHRIRLSGKPALLAVNKIDSVEQRAYIHEFHTLGLGEPIAVSAMHGSGGVGDLLDRLLEALPTSPLKEGGEIVPIRIALAGRPNVGKSSILNAVVGHNRTIVSDIPGTTRDAIDVNVTIGDHPYILVDTAGIRKKSRVDYGVEAFSVDRSLHAIRNADVTVIVLDAIDGVTDQDKKIIETSNKAGRGLVIAVNKWDLYPDKTVQSAAEYKKRLFRQIPHAAYAEIVFISAVTGQRLTRIFDLAKTAYENSQRRIKTSLVNQVVLEAVTLSPPPPIKNKFLKILYATQVSSGPPTFILFMNDDKLFKESYRRYLEKKIRAAFEFSGTPIVLLPRNRSEKK